MQEQDRIIKINIEEEMKSSYIDYSMSVIVARALPDVRDGFKPVHRRILYGMMELGNTSDKPYKKSARIVGEVLGKYHPHGDSSVYGALVRMAQDWAMRYPLVDGQGNFGSVDGDSPAAMRYTEARLKKIGEDMMQDLYKETVDFQNNFDDTLQEPVVMPTRIPNLLVNGASGIAVGMATNMPTHNLSEVIDACVAYIDNNEIDIDGLMQYIKAPDFPTGGYIYGISGVRDAYETGRGRVIMRAKAEIESHPTHDKIVVNEIPYNVNKKELIESIASLVNEKKIDGISYVNDESDREGMRIVIDVKRDANASIVLNKLYKMTMLQTSFGVNNVALVHGRPRLLNLKDKINSSIMFITHDLGVIAEMADYVVVMYAGRIVEQGTAQEIFAHPAHPYTIGLMASKPVVGRQVEKLYSIPGKVPNPINMPDYCYFKDRCEMCVERCGGEYPCEVSISPTHKVSCYRYYDGKRPDLEEQVEREMTGSADNGKEGE